METLENKIYKEATELEKKGNFLGAIQKYLELLKENPRSLLLLQSLGKCYLYQKDYANALNYFQKVVSIYPSEENFYREAECYISLGKILEAVQSLKKAVDINPSYVKANKILAKIYSQVGNYYKQEKYLQMILKFDPKNTFALKEMAYLCERTNRPKEALSYIEGYLYQTKDDLISSEILRVNLLLQIGNYASAWEHLNEVMQKNVSLSFTMDPSQIKTIREEIKRLSLEIRNNSTEKKPTIAFQLAFLYLMLGNIEKSSKYLIYSKKLNQDFRLSKVKIDLLE